MHRIWTTPARVLFVVFSLVSISTAGSTETAGPAIEERIRYQGLIERAYAERRVASTSDPVKSLDAGKLPSTEELRSKVEQQIKMADALDRVWGRRISQSDLQAEFDRILAHSNDREMLARLLDALDRDPEAVAANLVEPILVRRAVRQAYWWDAGIHERLRRAAEKELLTDDGAGGLAWFTGVRTETEWRLAAGDEPPGMEYENGVQIRRLDRERWDRLAEDLGHRWETTADSGAILPLLRFSSIEESKEFFSAAVILDQSSTHLHLATHTWWKRSFSDWWDEHAPEFSTALNDTGCSITLDRAHPSPRREADSKDRAVAGSSWFSMNTSDPDTPSARDQHAVVWTGTHMIIWGGTNGAQVFSSGGVYDPATDSWTATSQGADCPSARFGHAAAWSSVRSRIFVWGGWDGATNTNTGSKYNPVTDVWAALPVDADTPSARRGHIGVVLPDAEDFYVWGGRTTTSRTNSGALYDPTTNAWWTLPVGPDTPSARDEMVATTYHYVSFTELLVWGGNSGSSYLNDGGVRTSGEWDPIPSTGAPSPRFGHTGVATGGNPCGQTSFPDVFYWGGFTPYDPVQHSNTGGVYGLQYRSWEGSTPLGANVPAGRYDHSAVMDAGRNWMVVWGGETSSGPTSTGAVLDVCDGTWTPTDISSGDLPSARSGHTAIWTGKAMLVWGGFDGTALGDGGVYTHCWGTPATSLIPVVADEDPCTANGIRIFWNSIPTWNDYDVHRRVAILRDSAVIASDLLFSEGSYLDATAVEDESYDYEVRFINSCGESATTVSVSGVDQARSAPTVTVGPTAVDADGCAPNSGIDISWPTDPDDWGDDGIGDRQYRVWRWQNSFDGWVAQGTQLDYGTTAYHDPSPSFGKYRVKYINGCGKTTDSLETATVLDLSGAAPTVSQTVAGADADACSHTGNRVTWPADPDDWGDGGTGDRVYRVRRSIDGVNFNPIGDNIAYGTISYLDAAANPDQQYHYQVRYKNGCDLTTDSATDTATDLDGEAPVTGFNAAATDPDTCDDGGVAITWPQDGAFWGDGDSGTRSYEIVRGGTTIHTGIPYGTITYTDTTGVDGVPYTYRVRMVNGCGLSGLSGISDSAADLPAAPAISGVNNTAADTDSCAATGVLVTWSADPGGGWGDDGGSARTYDVLRDGIAIQTGITYGTTAFTDTNGTAGTDYLYTVRYVNCGGQYAETAGVAAADLQGAVPTLTANSSAIDTDNCIDGGITVSWPADADTWGDNGSGTRTYDLLRDGNAIQTGIGHPTTSLVDTTGVNGTAYLYQVRYNNGCGFDATTTGDNGNDRPVAPAAPANNTASDIDACTATGVLVTWNPDPDGPWGDGGGTHTYDVLRDGVTLQSDIAYGVTTFTDTTGTPGTPYVYTVRYVNCGELHTETTGVAAADINGTPPTPASPAVTDASACAQDGVWINWAPSSGATTYDLRMDGVTEVTAVADPYLYDPGDTSMHTYEVRANGASCPGTWSQATILADLVDPDARFCNGFRSGDTSAWAVTAP
jgi:hypothetical protein